MNAVFRLRLLLDVVAIGLIVACLAYWWLDNLAHEVFGTALFALVIGHNVFNRRWYGGVAKRRLDAVRIVNLATIACLALGMTIMLVTSVLISRDLLPFMALDGAFAVRELHMFAAYWVLLVIAIHLGTRWQVVMNACAALLRLDGKSRWRTAGLRLVTAAVAAHGVESTVEMGFGSKLMLTYALDMWDFNASTLQFFVNYASIVGLFAAVTHYALLLVRRGRSGV
ncbi:DUF4405 domain-containing protein [Rhizobium sp. RM]|uniref:DUF4405 domain-containing protein n=1 Tax=Rhizobium sp. RM TaxID=2748079 RepID=UPI00110F5218|nr:DUF4405 domain-containing protein [Rhizobium sp. RM]NWJ26085.1 DUF4405 domain-containing protein [Rhizobium sp. RM]TMV20684.1 DUF4405 domain-containing protein [Rhizobium sp. Td3]